MAGGVHSRPPGPNIVIVHGCSTEANQNSNIAFAQTFDMMNKIMDRCYAGFDKIVWSVNHTTGERLSTHMKDVYDQLVQGQTINFAVQHANSTHPAAAEGGSPSLPLLIRGDPSARLMHVYTGNDASAITVWYLVGGSRRCLLSSYPR